MLGVVAPLLTWLQLDAKVSRQLHRDSLSLPITYST